MGGASIHSLSSLSTWRAWIPGSCHSIVKHWRRGYRRNRNSIAGIWAVDLPRNWSSKREKIVTTGQRWATCFHRLRQTLTQLGVGTDPDNPIVDRFSLDWVVEYFHDGGRVPCLRCHDVRCQLIIPGDLHDLARRLG